MKNSDREPNDAGLVEFLQTYGTDEACRKHLEATLWPNGPTCPKCNSTKAYPIKCETARPGLYKCGACKKQYTVTVGTLFEGSHIPLPTWFAAIYLMNASKKGMSAHQLHRSLHVTYKTAWFMCHRVRAAMSDPKPRKLRGKIEVDETYIGGKSRREFKGRSTVKKTPVLALVQRGGKVRTRVILNASSKELKTAIRAHVAASARLFTDQWSGYRGLDKEFASHETVNHEIHEYVRGGATTNSAESFFALLKRGVHGTFHHVSREHLHRYAGEFEFRWNLRLANDLNRALAVFPGIDGKRLTYKATVRA